jgi:hypothetical protein
MNETKPRRATTRDAEPRKSRAALLPEAITQDEQAPAPAADELVTAIVPKIIHLTLDDGRTVTYHPGTQDMPRAHAEHWWCKTNGVEIYGD